MEFNKEEYELPFFLKNGFWRKQCRVCGHYFWTQSHEQDTCGDAPCEEYTFIGRSPTKRSFTLEEIREAFLSFFEENGHTRIKPYPVIARWRDDLFVTIASIADFQPFVTGGVIPPPANPLVVSQPCLRFIDVDNVGLTAGRHGVIFEMGGHHAFNYPDRYVYWKDETVRYHHRFIADVLGVKSESVSYKESSWSGGGNAGPCLEGSVGGLEVCTLVFMQYNVVDDKLIEMPLKIVDTGYGIERYAWLSQGKPSGFHAIYGPLLDKIMSLAGVKVDEQFLVESAKPSALMNLESVSDRMALRKRVAERVNIDPLELDRAMVPVESVYAVADHTKAMVFMLAEGVVPSNVKAGYLTRLLVRRTYRLLRNLGIEDRLRDIVEWQIERWAPTFPHLKDMREEILEALVAEERKYRATLKRGEELTRRIVHELKAKGQKGIGEDILAELYDSHGVPPEIVAESAKAESMEVLVPDNFYTTIASRHQAPSPVKEELETKEMAMSVADLPATEMLYYDNPYTRVFRAQVMRVVGDRVVLNRTAFYPEGGGQEYDTGVLDLNGREVKVVRVERVGNVVVHTVEGQPPAEEQEVSGRVDWERRLSLMRHHTSTHLMLGAIRQVLGQHAWQAGAEKEPARSRLDVSHWDRITPEQLVKIEQLANQRVMDDTPVEVLWLPRDIAEKTYGFRLYQGGVVPGSKIRVIKIGEWDVEACGGTHLRSTGEVGLIKIQHTERIQDGVERIVFSSGVPALEFIQRIDGQVKVASEALNVLPEQLGKAVCDLAERIRGLEKEVGQLREGMVHYDLEEALGNATTFGDVRFVAHVCNEVNPQIIIGAVSTLIKGNPDAVAVVCSTGLKATVIVMAGEDAVKAGVNSGVIASEVANVLGGGGSGRLNFGQGGGTRVDRVDEALRVASGALARQVGRP